MNTPPPLTAEEFAKLLADHGEIIRLANELEESLYRLGDSANSEAATGCQQAAGTLIGRLRQMLFVHDQRVFPLLETILNDPARIARLHQHPTIKEES